MDNIITGFIGMALFLAFVGGLAQSIGALPFVVIVAVIGALAFYDYYENVREERRRSKYLSLHEAIEDGANKPTVNLD